MALVHFFKTSYSTSQRTQTHLGSSNHNTKKSLCLHFKTSLTWLDLSRPIKPRQCKTSVQKLILFVCPFNEKDSLTICKLLMQADSLRTLYISGYTFPNACSSFQFSVFQCLKILDISYCHNAPQHISDMPFSVPPEWRITPMSKKLDIEFVDDSCNVVLSLKNVTELCVSDANSVDHKWITIVSAIKHLTFVSDPEKGNTICYPIVHDTTTWDSLETIIVPVNTGVQTVLADQINDMNKKRKATEKQSVVVYLYDVRTSELHGLTNQEMTPETWADYVFSN